MLLEAAHIEQHMGSQTKHEAKPDANAQPIHRQNDRKATELDVNPIHRQNDRGVTELAELAPNANKITQKSWSVIIHGNTSVGKKRHSNEGT